MHDQQGQVLAIRLAVFDGLEAADGDRKVMRDGDTWVYFVHGCAGQRGQPGRMVYSSRAQHTGRTWGQCCVLTVLEEQWAAWQRMSELERRVQSVREAVWR